MRSPAAEHHRPVPGDALVAAVIAAAAVILLAAFRPQQGSRLTATVSVDSTVVAEYRLDTLKDTRDLPLDGLPYPVTLRLEPGRICILESQCPGRDCVRTGWADRAGDQIICLPNRLVISLSGDGQPDFDAVSG